MKKFAFVIGTRPDVPKNYSIAKELKKRGIPFIIIHTNQHKDAKMSTSLFAEMGYFADYVLPLPYSFGKALDQVREILFKEKIDTVIVNGDTAATLIGALAAMYSDKEIVHVEAGLRSYDPHMLEERNRIMVDAMAHHLLTYTNTQAELLRKTPALRGKISVVGNVTLDIINDFKDRLVKLSHEDFFYITLHRKELTDYKEKMIEVFNALREISEKTGVMGIFPMHPRTLDCCQRYEIDYKKILGEKIEVIDPVTTFASMAFERDALTIVTDSGCIQEEACIFNTPCVTVRENTERPETIYIGANFLAGFDKDTIVRLACASIEDVKTNGKKDFPKIYGEPGVGKKIVDIIIQ